MNQVKVITDSTAGIPSQTAQELGIHIVPLKIRLGSKTYREGLDITSEEFLKRLSCKSLVPSIFPPSVADFQKIYTDLCREGEEIISIHNSSKLSATTSSAIAAQDSLLGRCEIVVMDSMLISLGLSELVAAAARAAQEGTSLEGIVKLIRGMIPHIYIVVIGASLDYLERGRRIGHAEAFLSSMLSVKPILILEDGDFIPMEKVRGRTRALERLYEFIAEFPQIEKLAVLQSTSNHEVDELVERIVLTLPSLKITKELCSPSLASLIGPGSLAIIVYEGT